MGVLSHVGSLALTPHHWPQPAWPHLKRSVSWVHSSFAGLEHFLFAELAAAEGVTFTNAKGCFSASLAEFALFGAKYFMLDYDRARMNKVQKAWAPYFVDELRTMTMGIVGYGSIGAACARLAKAYQMRVVGLRRSGEGAEGVERMYLGQSKRGDKQKLTNRNEVCRASHTKHKEKMCFFAPTDAPH